MSPRLPQVPDLPKPAGTSQIGTAAPPARSTRLSFGPAKKPIERPDVRSALTDEALRALSDDAERMRELAGREFRDWSIWKA